MKNKYIQKFKCNIWSQFKSAMLFGSED